MSILIAELLEFATRLQFSDFMHQAIEFLFLIVSNAIYFFGITILPTIIINSKHKACNYHRIVMAISAAHIANWGMIFILIWGYDWKYIIMLKAFVILSAVICIQSILPLNSNFILPICIVAFSFSCKCIVLMSMNIIKSILYKRCYHYVIIVKCCLKYSIWNYGRDILFPNLLLCTSRPPITTRGLLSTTYKKELSDHKYWAQQIAISKAYKIFKLKKLAKKREYLPSLYYPCKNNCNDLVFVVGEFTNPPWKVISIIRKKSRWLTMPSTMTLE